MANVGQLGDRAGMSAATTGTGTVTLGSALGAVAPNLCSFQAFSSAGITDQMTVSYLILDSNGAWEVGRGTYTASGTTLTRGPTFSSNSNSAINLSGNEQIFISLLQEDAVAVGLMVFTGGRVTLTSGTPVLSANTTAQTTIYYTPYLHNLISIYDGFVFQTYAFAEQSVALDSSNFLSGKNYDLFMALNAGLPTLGYGPAWTNNTTRANAISRQNGVWTNTATITLRTASGTTFSAAANKATYVGTARATANGQTGVTFNASASGGGAVVIGIYNAQNKVPISCWENDTIAGTSYTYASSTWRNLNGNTNNSISFIDGLGDIAPAAWATVAVGADTSSGSVGYAIGVGFNWSSGAPTYFQSQESFSFDVFYAPIASVGAFAPALGYNALTALEATLTGTANVNDVSGLPGAILMAELQY
jgi:hypothetical protein